MAKILYGKVHSRSEFDKVTRIKGTQTRVAQKGKEFFLLDTYFRVIGIYKSLESARLDYSPDRYARYLHLTLAKISSANKGRCTAAVSKQIFDALKVNSGRVLKKLGEKFELNGVKYKVVQIRSVYYYAEDTHGKVWRVRISQVV